MDKTELFFGFVVAVCVAVVIYLFLVMMSIPDVWFSYSTGECVTVVNYDENDNYSCENMPTKFNHVWVE